MSADFLPLEVGNRWVYELQNEDGRKIGELDFAVQEYTIISGRSFYVLTRFPFVVEGGGLTKLIRYDRQERMYVRMEDSEESPLFHADGASAEVLETDSSGLTVKFILKTDLMDLTFQRGLGIVEAKIHGPNGLQIAKITNARVGEKRTGDIQVAQPGAAPAVPPPMTPEQKTKSLAESVAAVSEENPVLDVQVTTAPEGYKFVLTVMNISDKLLPFDFKTSQTYDFAVVDTATGQEVWRWSRRMFFSQVIRQESIRANGNWKFEVVWNRRDNDLNPVEPGRYSVVGIVATQPPIESQPAVFEIK
ncbi:MAG: hypothetical protein HY646_00525 [Acidobacteria bacterium]|nr:hypothetical protein [Acidobacteriota bacterium]